MSHKIAGGTKENGIVIGNTYDKYGSKNPIVKWMMKNFESSLSGFIDQVTPQSIHEIGCGEGYWILDWNEKGIAARGSDFSSDVISLAKENAKTRDLPTSLFSTKSIYNVTAAEDTADLIVCCEVLEHLEQPQLALEKLQEIVQSHLIVSVPREPIWCTLNLARGKYLSTLGNTPGHIQHWSKRSFIRLISNYFEVIDVNSPLPWTMLLCKKRS